MWHWLFSFVLNRKSFNTNVALGASVCIKPKKIFKIQMWHWVFSFVLRADPRRELPFLDPGIFANFCKSTLFFAHFCASERA